MPPTTASRSRPCSTPKHRRPDRRPEHDRSQAGQELLRWLNSLPIPWCWRNVVPVEIPAHRLEWVATDHAFGAGMAVRHLWQEGHRKIGCLDGFVQPHQPACGAGLAAGARGPEDSGSRTRSTRIRRNPGQRPGRAFRPDPAALPGDRDHRDAGPLRHPGGGFRAALRGPGRGRCPGAWPWWGTTTKWRTSPNPPSRRCGRPSSTWGASPFSCRGARCPRGGKRPVHRIELNPELIVRESSVGGPRAVASRRRTHGGFPVTRDWMWGRHDGGTALLLSGVGRYADPWHPFRGNNRGLGRAPGARRASTVEEAGRCRMPPWRLAGPGRSGADRISSRSTWACPGMSRPSPERSGGNAAGLESVGSRQGGPSGLPCELHELRGPPRNGRTASAAAGSAGSPCIRNTGRPTSSCRAAPGPWSAASRTSRSRTNGTAGCGRTQMSRSTPCTGTREPSTPSSGPARAAGGGGGAKGFLRRPRPRRRVLRSTRASGNAAARHCLARVPDAGMQVAEYRNTAARPTQTPPNPLGPNGPKTAACPTRTCSSRPIPGSPASHWCSYADFLLRSAHRYATDNHANIHLPGAGSAYGPRSDSLEAFARTFLMASFRMAGDPENTGWLADWYARGLDAGTNPASQDRWPTPGELGQAKVEAASLAVGLALTREILWDKLPQRVQEQLVAWFETVIGEEYPAHQLGLVPDRGGNVAWPTWEVVIPTRTSTPVWPSTIPCTGGTDGSRTAPSGHTTTTWAGPSTCTRSCGLLMAPRNRGCVPAGRSTVHALQTILDDAVYLVGANGCTPHPGAQPDLPVRRRSSVLGRGTLVRPHQLSPGVSRRAASGMLDHFAGATAAITDDGLLSIGWHGEFAGMKQSYSGGRFPLLGLEGNAGASPARRPSGLDGRRGTPAC